MLKQYPTMIAMTENNVSIPAFLDRVNDFTNNTCAIAIGSELNKTVPI